MQPAPSETTNPLREREKGQLASDGGTGASPSLGRYAPFIVANPARIGSTSGKSTAPQIATSAIPWAMNIAPRIRELLPVAQAVTPETMGPVAPVKMATLPPSHIDAGIGIHEGLGKLSRSHQGPVRFDQRVETADRGTEGDGHPRGHLRRDRQPGHFQGAVDDKKGMGEDRGGPVGHLAGPEKGIRRRCRSPPPGRRSGRETLPGEEIGSIRRYRFHRRQPASTALPDPFPGAIRRHILR